MSKVLFKHELMDTYEIPISNISIIDSDKDNVIIDDRRYTITKENIDTIKKLLNNDKLYTDNDVLFSPILDGSVHKILLSGNKIKEIECFNLWYWADYKKLNGVRNTSNKEDFEYTKSILELIDAIQNILNDNDINYYILKDEE